MLQTQELKLETRRLVLRRPDVSDARNVQTLIDNWNVVKWLARVPWPYPGNGAAEWLERMHEETASGAAHAFGVYVKSRPFDGLVGVVGLHLRENDEWEMGYWLGEPYWGRGYMSEAAPAVVRFAFEHLKLPRIEAGYLHGNQGSARVLLRCGFEYTGESRRWCEPRGHDVDAMDMELSAEKWATYTRPQAAE